MTPKSKNIAVGLFVVILSIGAVFFITWMGSTTIQDESDTYVAYLDESVSGLSPNSSVKYKGVTIGQVERIQINPNNSNQVELRLLIKQGTPIKTDSQLVLTSQGITGLQYIEITGGSEDKPFLKAESGEELPVIPTGKSTLATVQAAIGPMLNNINLTIEDIRQILKSANPENLSSILSDIQLITGLVAGNADSIFRDVQVAVTGLRQAIEQTNGLIDNTNAFFNSRQAQVTTLVTRLNESSGTVNRLLNQMEKEQIVPTLGGTLTQMNQLIQNLNTYQQGPLLSLSNEVNQSALRLNRLLQDFEEAQIVQGVGNTITNVDQLTENLNGPIKTQLQSTLDDISKSTLTLNRLVSQIEQEGVIQGVGRTVAQAEKITKSMESTAKNVDQFVSNLNQTVNNADQFVDNLNQTANKTDQFMSNLNQTANKADQFIGNLNQTANKADQFVDNLNQTANKADQFMSNLNQTAGKADQFVDNLNQTANKADQFMSNLNQTATQADQFVGNLNQSATKADQFIGNLNEASRNVNQFVANLNQTAVKTDQFVVSLNQSIKKIDQLLENVNDQVSSQDLQSIPRSLNSTLEEIEKFTQTLNRTAEESDFVSVIEELRETLAEIQAFAQTWTQVAEELENQPSALIFGDSKKEIQMDPQQ